MCFFYLFFGLITLGVAIYYQDHLGFGQVAREEPPFWALIGFGCFAVWPLMLVIGIALHLRDRKKKRG